MENPAFYYVYILQSESNPSRFYSGFTENLKCPITRKTFSMTHVTNGARVTVPLNFVSYSGRLECTNGKGEVGCDESRHGAQLCRTVAK